MAKRRHLKKDIEYLIYEVISDCFTLLRSKKDVDQSKLIEILSDAEALGNDLIARVNHPDGSENPKIAKAHYNKVRHDLLTGVDALFERVSALAAQ
ncbi:MAG: hypothetical protein ABR519_03205 [Bacteroidales bacterium]